MTDDELDGALRRDADLLLEALRKERHPFPEMFSSPLPSGHEIDVALHRKYGAPLPPKPRAKRL